MTYGGFNKCKGCGECEATPNGYCESCNELDKDYEAERGGDK